MTSEVDALEPLGTHQKVGHLYAYLIETGFITPMRAVPPAAPTPSG